MNVHQLATIAFGSHGCGKFMPLTASYDGSGKENQHPVITVAGYCADDSLCRMIESEWNRATDGKVFHFTDFGSESCKLGSRQWSESKRISFLKHLASIINREGVQLISHSVEVAQYGEFRKTSDFADIYGPPYSFLATWAVYAIEDLLQRRNLHLEKVAHVFEKGERAHELLQAMTEFEQKGGRVPPDLRSHHFMSKDNVLLQPADFIAGITQRLLIRSCRALGCLDNGLPFTPITNFSHYYSDDGITASLIPSKPTVFRSVVNKPSFNYFDNLTSNSLGKFPSILNARRKAKMNQGKKLRTHQ